MKILITGSSGFIGSALKNLLEKRGIEIVPFDIKDNPENDVRELTNLNSKVQGVNGIIHLAAVSRVKLAYEDPITCINTNVKGMINVLESARSQNYEKEPPWVIFGSSREVFGELKNLPATETTFRNPINVYGVSKLSGEELCRVYSNNFGLKARILRFSNVYTGINDHLDRVIPRFIFQASRNEDLVINGSGNEIFDFTYISDTIQGIWGCIQEIEKSELLLNDFNLSSGIPISLKNLAETIVNNTKSSSQIKYAESRTYDVNRFYANPKKAKEILRFSPKIPLEEGIKLALSDFRNHGMLDN